ncbi:hypothetical protein KZ483_17340 [Paenibacillus sp. sptzw28]|uniref:hypothetical protein n=1 Tax=Paenibacillus sp. sptzw28 TaxID=715179 RepID=UPI001C6F3CE6|nr:hypothetical protein [Paenibacillus sp. sptzw28]QYR19654.1 hypothetical protein KZ483_17340 [Paenibacillus sp. sptzw28]
MNQPDNEKVYELNKECSLEDHRPCMLTTAVGMAADISEQEGLTLSPQLQYIMETQRLTDSGVRSALREWVNTIPESQKEVAAELLSIVENG